ncbi:MAG: hypothetical protein PHY43_03970 [Verrucomicrobiales bacterium]|nr:hypothetical protein [Verrucomicrobiales bacterium]
MTAREFDRQLRRRQFVEHTAAKFLAENPAVDKKLKKEVAAIAIENAETLAATMEETGNASWGMAE